MDQWVTLNRRIFVLCREMGLDPQVMTFPESTEDYIEVQRGGLRMEVAGTSLGGPVWISSRLALDPRLRPAVLMNLERIAEALHQFGCAFFPQEDQKTLILKFGVSLWPLCLGYGSLEAVMEALAQAQQWLQEYFDPARGAAWEVEHGNP